MASTVVSLQSARSGYRPKNCSEELSGLRRSSIRMHFFVRWCRTTCCQLWRTPAARPVAYFAQAAVVYEKLLGRVTPILPRFSATLLEAKPERILARYQLGLTDVLLGPEKLRKRLPLVRCHLICRPAFRKRMRVRRRPWQQSANRLATWIQLSSGRRIASGRDCGIKSTDCIGGRHARNCCGMKSSPGTQMP